MREANVGVDDIAAGLLLVADKGMRETIRATDGVTYWGTDAKARRALGHESRTLAQGMADLAAERT